MWWRGRPRPRRISTALHSRLNLRHRLQHRPLARRKAAVDARVDLTLACRRGHRLQCANRVLHLAAVPLRGRLHRCTNHPFGISIRRRCEDRRSYHLAFFRRETRVQTRRQFTLTSRWWHPAQSSNGIPHFGASFWNLPHSRLGELLTSRPNVVRRLGIRVIGVRVPRWGC